MSQREGAGPGERRQDGRCHSSPVAESQPSQGETRPPYSGQGVAQQPGARSSSRSIIF